MPEGFILSALSIGFGFILGELSYYFRMSREDKRKIRLAIFALSDFVAQLDHDAAIMGVLAEAKTSGPATAYVAESLTGDFDDNPDQLRQRLEESASSIAEFDPLLGRELLSYTRTVISIQASGNLASDFGSTHRSIKARSILYDKVATELKRSIVKLARRHDWRLWFQYKNELKSDPNAAIVEHWRDILESVAELDENVSQISKEA